MRNCDDEVIEIVQGDDAVLNLECVDDWQAPVDLTGSDVANTGGLTAIFVKSDGTLLTKTSGVALVSGPKGQVAVTLTPADTQSLKVGVQQNFDLVYKIGGRQKTVRFEAKLTVEAILGS